MINEIFSGYAASSAVRNLLGGRYILGAVQGAVAAAVTKSGWQLAGAPLSVGLASSGWEDLSQKNFDGAKQKLAAAALIANGILFAYTPYQAWGLLTVRDAAIASVAGVGAGFVHAVGTKAIGWVASSVRNLFSKSEERETLSYVSKQGFQWES